MNDESLLSAEDYLNKANALWFQGQPRQALEFYELAVAALPEDASEALIVNVKSAYALCLCDVGNFNLAFELYPQLEKLCEQGNLDKTMVLRQWAKAFEQVGHFGSARQTYEKIPPNDQTSSGDRLKWEHAMGLLNWREGRLTEAAENLAAATASLPSDPVEASKVLAVLGNDALLSLDLGNAPRAYRLVDQMLDIRAAVEDIPLPSEVNLFKVRAALARQRGDHKRETEILKDGVSLVEQRDPDEWMRRLDLVSEYVAASQRAGPSKEARDYLAELCRAAPFSVAWIGSFMLAQLQIDVADFDGARESIETVLASFVGAGAAESEVEVISMLAALAHQAGRGDAAIFLGKLALKYLAEIAHSFDSDELRKIVEAGDKLVAQTTGLLHEAGRYEEAQSLDHLFDRVRRYALVMRKPATSALAFQPIPFDRLEQRGEQDWLAARQQLVASREAGNHEETRALAAKTIKRLLAFETASGLADRTIAIAAPRGRNLRLSFVPSGEVCQLHYLWSDRAIEHQIDMAPSSFFSLVADLRSAISDRDAWREPAGRLYELLIDPIEAELDDIECLEIDASGILGRIPMNVLTKGERCVVQRVAIKYVVNAEPTAIDPEPRQGLVHLAAFSSGPLAVRPAAFDKAGDVLGPVAFGCGPAFTRQGLLDYLDTKPAYVSIATHLETEPARPDMSTLLLGTKTPLYLSDFGGEAFDFRGVEVALFATCSSGLDDVTEAQGASLAQLVLEKGASCFVGTLWDISEATAARFVDAFWQAFLRDPSNNPATVLAQLQSGDAAQGHQTGLDDVAAGGIGSPSRILVPQDWAAFAIFENGNALQRTEQ